MRKRFEQQNELDAQLIPDVKIDGKSRHELPQLLAGLQYIFITPKLNEAVFEVLERRVLGDKKATGRLGLSLWEILVLGTMRLNLDTDYDTVYDLANHHEVVRGILGVHTKQVFGEGKYYPLQTLKDNIALLDEEALKEISEVVVKAGHELKKNEGEESLELNLKADTYAVESNIHFPTDINLLWDCVRKCLDTIELTLEEFSLPGWRKRNYWRKVAKRAYRRTANIHQKKGKNYKDRLKKAAEKYLRRSRELSQRVDQSRKGLLLLAVSNIRAAALLEALSYYHEMLEKHIDLVERRIIKGETIPHKDKVFSIFEPHVEWIQKGKPGQKVELGHNALITTDQFQFIVDHEVLVGEGDQAQPIPLAGRLKTRFAEGYFLNSISFDRGFFSVLAKKALQQDFEHVIMPRKGKKTPQQEAEENSKTFVALRKKHSAVESNINELEHSGANRVPDKGLDRFKKYVALGVLAYNLKRLGKIVMEQGMLTTVVRPGNSKRAA
ncbi:ISNCY family transposase [candidate division KSB1 bacterium]|nr:ISNCY family transposase [candidate division KSB1 bacterium]